MNTKNDPTLIYNFSFLSKDRLSEEFMEDLSKIFCFSLEAEGIIFGNSLFLLSSALERIVFDSKIKILLDNNINNVSVIITRVAKVEGYENNYISLAILENQKDIKVLSNPRRTKSRIKFTSIFVPKIETPGGFKLRESDYNNIATYVDVSCVDLLAFISKGETPSNTQIRTDDLTIDDILDKIKIEGIKSLTKKEIETLKGIKNE